VLLLVMPKALLSLAPLRYLTLSPVFRPWPSSSVMYSSDEPLCTFDAVGSKSMIGCTALPSALAMASVLFCAVTLSAPPATMLRPSEMVARETESATVTPMAPATLTCEPPPPLPAEDVSALARLVLPVVPAPAPACVPRWLAKPCWPSTWPLAPSRLLLEFEPLSWLLPPATLALACELLFETVRALTPTAPVVLTLRSMVAKALSRPMVRASEMPTPVSPDLVSPSAIVCAEPSCAALSVTSPVD
jgi:hypothetical protein